MTAITNYKSILLLAFMTIWSYQALAQTFGQTAEKPESKHFLSCLAAASGTNDDQGYRAPNGRLGLFQFSVKDAQLGGLCGNDVPVTGELQAWKLCDFKGVVAKNYDIHNQYDLRFSGNAADAQLATMQNLSKYYDNHIFRMRYDRFFGKTNNGIPITREAVRALLLMFGPNITDAYLNGIRVTGGAGGLSPYTPLDCLTRCLANDGHAPACAR